MADDIESTKQQHHAQLAAEHQRLAQFHSEHSGGNAPNTNASAGAQVGGFFATLAEHKWWVVGGIAAFIAIFFVILPKMGSGSGSNNTANQSPDLSQGGYVPANISAQLDNINTEISGLANQIGNGNGGTTTPPPPTGGGGNPPNGIMCQVGYHKVNGVCVPDFHLCPLGTMTNGFGGCTPISPVPVNPPPTQNPPAPQHKYVTVAKWLPMNTPWNSTLWGIANHEGLTLRRIEQLNPQIKNPNLIYKGERVEIS